MTTLYRKYRPQTFSTLVGQDYITQTITNEISLNKLAQAYLFAGPRGTGKTSFARLLAKAVNCEARKDKEFEPCNSCLSCEEITSGRNIDVVEIDAASQTGVDNVRENIIENARFKPTKSKYKIFIIDEVHMLSTSAFNALLKTLEEPPEHAIFILATTEQHKLPATVISRCQRFQFKKISFDIMKERLKKICEEESVRVAPSVLERIIVRSEGGLRDAESLLGQVFALQLKTIDENDVGLILPISPIESVLNYLQCLLQKDVKGSFECLNALAEEGTVFDQFILQVLEILRVMLVLKNTDETHKLSSAYSEETVRSLKHLTETITSVELLRLIDLTLKRKQEIKSTPLPQLPLELLTVEFSSSSAEHSQFQIPLIQKNKGVEEKEHVISEKKPSPQSSSPTIKIQPPSLEEKEEEIETPSTLITASLDSIKQEWNNVITCLTKKSAALTFVAKMSLPKKIDTEGLVVTVPYDFHKEKLMEAKNRKIFEEVLEEIFKEKIRFWCEQDTSKNEPSDNQKINENELSDLMAAFGGEVVG
jgi:DNA polymerase-3 subunit gamma/tau